MGTSDEVAEWLREIAVDLNIGQFNLLLHFGNMDRDLTRVNTELFASGVLPQIRDLFTDRWEYHWWRRGREERVSRPAGSAPRTARASGAGALSASRARSASALRERSATVAGVACRVWEQGAGPPVTFLPGIGGLPRWSAFLDALARSRRVVAPSVPASRARRRCPNWMTISTGCWPPATCCTRAAKWAATWWRSR